MLSLASYGWYTRRPGAGRYALLVVLFTLGLLSKAMAVTLPLVLLLLDYFPLARFSFQHAGGPAGPRGGLPARLLLLEKAPPLLLSTFTAAMAYRAVQIEGMVVSTTALAPALRLANALRSCLRYLAKAVFPSDLAALYPYPERIPPWQTAASLALLGALSLLSVRLARRRPWLFTGWWWYLVTLLPVIGLVQVGALAMADRYTYIPLIGLGVALSWGGADLAGRLRGGAAALPLLAAALLAAWSAASWRQAGWWKDSVTLFRHTLDVTENNAVAHVNLGVALRDRGERAAAEAHFRRALEIDPGFDLAHYNLGLSLEEEGRPDDALAEYGETLRANPRHVLAHLRTGLILEQRGQAGDAALHYGRALEGDPGDSYTRYLLAMTLARSGREAEAADHLGEVLRIDPGLAVAHNNLGVLLARRGMIEEAVGHFHAALDAEPGYADARSNLEAIEPLLGAPGGPP